MNDKREFRDELKVLKRTANEAEDLSKKAHQLDERLDELIDRASTLAEINGLDTSSIIVQKKSDPLVIDQSLSWDVLKEKVKDDPEVDFADLLTLDEIAEVKQSIALLNIEFDDIHKLDKWDWAVTGAAGIIAALVDIFLVGMPAHKGMLGGAGNEGGPLSNFIREKMNNVSPEELNNLENNNKVLFDPSTNRGLDIEVPGINPRNHRLLSPGHDPVLGFLFGTKDVMNSTFSAIGTDGSWIVQDRLSAADPSQVGLDLFSALGKVFGHLQSDNPTTMGLPAPFMFLSQFLQGGSFGPKNRSFAEVCQAMYSYGHYDFRHFLSMSISPLIIEVIVRSYYAGRSLYEGKDIHDALPLANKPKVRTMLFTAHSIAAAANAGKVALSQNPLSINYSQWLIFFRYFFPQLKWILLDKPRDRFNFVQKRIDENWKKVDSEMFALWSVHGKDIFKL